MISGDALLTRFGANAVSDVMWGRREEGGGEWRLWANRIIVRRRQKLTFYNVRSPPILASLSHVKLLSFEAFAAFIPSRQLMLHHEDEERLTFKLV